MFAGTKKDTRDVGGEGAVFAGSKKCTRDGFACCHAERSEGSPPSQPKDNVTDLVIARRALLDMAISFAQYVILSVAKDLAGCANILWFGDLEILHFVQNDSA